MKKISLLKIIFLCIIFSSASFAANSKYELLDKIIAFVEKEVVTEKELEKEQIKIMQAPNDKKNSLNQQEIKKEALNNLINIKILNQYAITLGITTSTEEIDFFIENILKNNNLTLDELQNDLLNSGSSLAELKKDIKNNLTLKKIKEKEIMPYVNVSKYEIDAWLEKNKSVEDSNAEYRLFHILIKNELKNEKLKKVLEKLETESFKSLAEKESDGPYAQNGGDLGWNTLENLPSLFIEKVKEMNINEIVIINSSNGTHILKLEDKRNEQKKTKRLISEYKFQQILLKKTTLTSDNDLEDKIKNIKNLVLNGLDFKQAIKKYSEDTTHTGLNELNWINIENLLPEYKKNFESYPKENLIGPFKTQLGWHLIYIHDYQERDVTNEFNREIAKLELIRAKTELRFKDWMAVLIENSKIKIVEDNLK